MGLVTLPPPVLPPVVIEKKEKKSREKPMVLEVLPNYTIYAVRGIKLKVQEDRTTWDATCLWQKVNLNNVYLF